MIQTFNRIEFRKQKGVNLTQNKMFKKGDIIKMTDRYAAVLARAKKAKPTKWQGRKGVVNGCNDTAVSVRWDGRRSLDWVPLGAVERFDWLGAVKVMDKQND